MQRLKGMADGWSNRHSAAQWTPAVCRVVAHWEMRAGLWMKHWMCVLCRARGEVRGVGGGGSEHAFTNLHMNMKKRLKMWAGLIERTNPAFPCSSPHSCSKHFVLKTKPSTSAVKSYDRQEDGNHLLKLIYTDNCVVQFTTHSTDIPFRLAVIKTCCTKQSSLPL